MATRRPPDEANLSASPSRASFLTNLGFGRMRAWNAPADVPESPSTQPCSIRLVPHLESVRSLVFDAVERTVPPNGYVLKVGRFNEKGEGVRSAAGGGGEKGSQKIAFRSKVVSRCHAEIWLEDNGQFFIKDTSSSSGTFLNHIRLSPPGVHSKPFPLKDSDIIQLGVDFQGGHEEIYRCVKMKIELGKGREWQRGKNEFNTNAMQQLQALSETAFTSANTTAGGTVQPHKRVNITDCCICLFSVSILQSLFIAPCSHVFHYKCIRPLLTQNHPGFSCPLCRTFADLDADVERDDWGSVVSRRASTGLERAATGMSSVAPIPPFTITPLSPLPITQPSAPVIDPSQSNMESNQQPAEPVPELETSAASGPVIQLSPEHRVSAVSSTDELSQRSEFGFPEHDCSPEAEIEDPFESGIEHKSVLYRAGTSTSPARAINMSPRTQSDGVLSPFGRLSMDSPVNGNMDAATPRNETFLSQLADSPHPPAAMQDNDITQVGEVFEANVRDAAETTRPARQG